MYILFLCIYRVKCTKFSLCHLAGGLDFIKCKQADNLPLLLRLKKDMSPFLYNDYLFLLN